MTVFLNGQFLSDAEAVVPVNDRGFMYGDGLFETLRVVNGKPFRMAQQSGADDARRGLSEDQTAVHAQGAGEIRPAAHRA